MQAHSLESDINLFSSLSALLDNVDAGAGWPQSDHRSATVIITISRLLMVVHKR